jgi:FlaA1/EpsC-like NDP-sugar epimerase
VGVRPGEKLFEELTYTGENFVPTAHTKIRRFLCRPADLAQLRETLQRLRAKADAAEPEELKNELRQAIPEYAPRLLPNRRGLSAQGLRGAGFAPNPQSA